MRKHSSFSTASRLRLIRGCTRDHPAAIRETFDFFLFFFRLLFSSPKLPSSKASYFTPFGVLSSSVLTLEFIPDGRYSGTE